MKAKAAVWLTSLALFAAGAALGAAQNPPKTNPQVSPPPVTLQPIPQVLRTPPARNLPDITNTKGGIIIGGAVGGAGGIFVPWGTSADLSSLTPLAVAGTVVPNGKCAFNITYHETNIGSGPTSPLYTNTLKVIGPTNVAINSGRHLNAGEDKEVDTQAYLPEGSNALMLDLNDGHIAAESNYGNNFFSIKYTLQCGKPGNPNNPNATPTPTTKPNPNATPTPTPNPNGNPTGGPNGNKLADVTSAKGGIIIGGAMGGAGGKFVPWGGVVDLDDVDPLPGTANADQCAFNATYVETNIGGAPTSPLFTNKLKRDGSADVAINSAQHLNVGEIRSVTTQPYLMIGGHGLELSLNDGHIAAESNYGNNVFSIRYTLKQCKRPTVAKCDGLPDLISILPNPMSGVVIERNIGKCPAGPNKLTIVCRKEGLTATGAGGGCAQLPPTAGPEPFHDPAFPNALTINVPALAPGATYSFTIPFWGALHWNPGTYLFVAKADAANVVAESNEGNNVSNSTLTVP